METAEEFGSDSLAAEFRENFDRGYVRDNAADLLGPFENGEACQLRVYFGDPCCGIW